MVEEKMAEGEPTFEELWALIQDGLDQLVTCVESEKRPFTYPQHMHYCDLVYRCCTGFPCDENEEDMDAPPPQIYARYKVHIAKYLTRRRERASKGGLSEIVCLWRHHTRITSVMRKICDYVNRYWREYRCLPTLEQCGTTIFRTEIYAHVRKPLLDALLASIESEREETLDRDVSVMRDAVSIFVEMGMGDIQAYQDDFEAPFLATTAHYYKRRAEMWGEDQDSTRYLIKTEERLNKERQSALTYLHSTTEPKLTCTIEHELLASNQKRLIEMEGTGVVALLEAGKMTELGRMVRLFKRIPKGLEPIAVIIKDFCTSQGMQVVRRHAEATSGVEHKAFVADMIEVHTRFYSMLTDVLLNDPVFQKAIKDAFEHFLNQSITHGGEEKHSAELLSNYCDTLMRGSAEKMSDEELECVEDKVVSLFLYLADKDMFQEFYRKQLSKRLLLNNTDDSLERGLIAKLKTKCGTQLTSKLEGMLNDRKTSEENQKKFKVWLDKEGHAGLPNIDFTTQVLTTGFWPSFKGDKLNLPAEVQVMLGHFKEFYASTTKARVLTWVNAKGSATLSSRFPASFNEIAMSVYQASVLLQFNTRDTLSGAELVTLLGIEWDEVWKALAGLTSGKHKLLLRNTEQAPKRKEQFRQTDQFTFNAEFKSATRKLRVANATNKPSSKMAQQVVQQVEEDRRHAVDACVVRLMKSRREMPHNELVASAISQLVQHFTPDPRLIKKRIEDLIEREYLERDYENPNTYRYVA